MARRRLLTGEERRRLFDIPHDETAIVGHYTLAAEDLELVGRRYRPANRLGLATQISIMRHPGFGLQPDVDIPDAVLHYLAAQLCVDDDVFADYGQRAQTCNDNADIESWNLRLQPFRQGAIKFALDPAANVEERPGRGEACGRVVSEW